MNPLLQHLRSHSSTPLHTAIVIGAGNGRELPEWRQLGAEHLLLVEAHPQLAEELNRRLQPERGERLLAMAATATPCNEARLLSLNNPAYSSLNAPAALQEHYPNLRLLETLTVPARSIGQLLDEPELDAEATHLLQVDAPGQALALLQAIPTETLQAFTWLIVGCASEPLYENDASAESIANWLQEIGFDCLQEDPDAIYPQSRLLLQRNPASVQRQRLYNEVAALRQQLLQQQNNSQQQLAALEQEKAALIAARDSLAQALDEQAKLAAERQAQLDALSQEKADLIATRDALAQDKQTLAQARDEQAKLAAERQAQLDALSKEKADLVATRDALAQDKQALAQARDEQAKLAAERQTQLDALSQEKADLIATRDALAQARDEQAKLASERQTQLDKLKAECDQAQKTASERQKTLEQAQQRIKTLENEASENLQRQQLLQEELIKAEAQIELIKDLLLREPGL